MDQDWYARWQVHRRYLRVRLTPGLTRAVTPSDVLAHDVYLRRMHAAYHRRNRR